MKHFARLSSAAAVALLLCGHVVAAPAPTADPCVDLQNNVNAVMKKRLADSAPKESPSESVQKGFDVKGIMSMDVTAGFSKLMSLDFSGLADTLLKKGLEKAQESGTAYFNNGVNNVLTSYGVQGINIPAVASGNFSSVAGAASVYGQNQVNAGIAKATVYGQSQVNAGIANATAGTGIDASKLAGQSVQYANAAKKAADDAAAAAAKAAQQSLYSRMPVRDGN